MVFWNDLHQEWAAHRKASALASQVDGTVMWWRQTTTVSFYLLAKWWGVSLRSKLYCSYLQGGLATSGEFPTTSDPISALFWVMKEDSWFVSQLRIWYVLASHQSLCLSAAIMNTRERVWGQLWECFTEFCVCSKIKEWFPLLVL